MITSLQHKTSFALVVALLSILSGAGAVALGQSTNFTYQGRLTDGGTPANGNYDLQFALFDSLSGGSQVGSTQTLNTVAVSNGVFTVSLDFGANAFPGASRFLEISARPSGSGSFTLLTPRQQITSTPYAVRSLNATSADRVVVNGQTAFNISGLGNFANTNTFAGVGAGAATTPDANGNGSFNSFFGSSAGQSNTSGGTNSFFGQRAGFSNTTGCCNAFFGYSSGSSNTTGFDNSFFGENAGLNNTSGNFNSFLGRAAGLHSTGNLNTMIGYFSDVLTGPILVIDNATAIGARARVDASNSLVLGSINGINGATADTNVGIGTTSPTARLSVMATGPGAKVLLLGTERPWVFQQFGTGAGTGLELTGDDPANNNKTFAIRTDGNVGIGLQGPLDKLHVFGDIRVGSCLKNSNGGTIAGTCASDLRFKRNITPFPNLLNKVMQLRPVNYYWRAAEFPEKHFGNARDYGLVAQEVEQVLPELVSEDAKGYKLVDYSKLPLLLLQAVKEQQAQIQQQQKLIERQQALAVRQQQQLNALKRLTCRSHRRAGVCQ